MKRRFTQLEKDDFNYFIKNTFSGRFSKLNIWSQYKLLYSEFFSLKDSAN